MKLGILLLLVLLLLIFLMVQSQQLEAMWQQYKEKQGHKSVVDGISVLEQQGKQLWRHLRGQQPVAQGGGVETAVFRAWVQQSPLVDATTETWFRNLSEEKLLVVQDFATEFGHHMGFDLGWIVYEQLPDKLDETLSSVLASYLNTCRLVLSNREEIHAFADGVPTTAEATASAQNGYVRT